jgi:AcrR family transcriptional regulator
MGRPAKFSREQLQAVALEIVDAQGLGGLSMRSLATRLGTGPMTLYNHIADRADLDVLVVDGVMAKAELPREPVDDWREELEAVATAVWIAVRAHPEAIPLILTRRSRSAAVLDVAEALLGALARGGRSGVDLLIAFRAVSAFIVGFAQAELAGPLAAAADEAAAAVIARVRALSLDRYPHLIDIAGVAQDSSPQTEFRAALRELIAGFASGGTRGGHPSHEATPVG